jgi:hypothetical protein
MPKNNKKQNKQGHNNSLIQQFREVTTDIKPSGKYGIRLANLSKSGGTE